MEANIAICIGIQWQCLSCTNTFSPSQIPTSFLHKLKQHFLAFVKHFQVTKHLNTYKRNSYVGLVCKTWTISYSMKSINAMALPTSSSIQMCKTLYLLYMDFKLTSILFGKYKYWILNIFWILVYRERTISERWT